MISRFSFLSPLYFFHLLQETRLRIELFLIKDQSRGVKMQSFQLCTISALHLLQCRPGKLFSFFELLVVPRDGVRI